MASTAFSGTTQKCCACEKRVYFVEQLNADGRVYHRACFRCHHCKGTLKFSNYSSFEGVLYCKPHYDQLIKTTGSLDKSFEGAPRSAKMERSNDHEGYVNNRISSVFVGTQDKCVLCKKTVYPIEKVAIDGNSYHRPCFKCARGGCTISPSSFIAHEGRLYCKHHHTQLFMAKGNFSQLENVENPPLASSNEQGSSNRIIANPPLASNEQGSSNQIIANPPLASSNEQGSSNRIIENPPLASNEQGSSNGIIENPPLASNGAIENQVPDSNI